MSSRNSDIVDLYVHGNDDDTSGGSRQRRSGRRKNYNPRYAKQKRGSSTPLGINGRGRGRSVGGCAKKAVDGA